MPRPNPPRQLAENIARRIAQERERRGWTYAALAEHMKAAGCPINASAAFKIEKGTPRRQVSAAEMFAFAAVFGVPVEDLAVPPELAAEREVVDTLRGWADASDVLGRASHALDEVTERLRALLAASPSAVPAAAAYLSRYAGEKWPHYTLEQNEEATEYLLLTLRGLPRDSAEWRAFHDRYTHPRGSNGEHQAEA